MSDQVRRIRLPILFGMVLLFTTGCIINAKAAEKESLEVLEGFLSAFETGEILLEEGNEEPIQGMVEKEYERWFTKDYQGKVSKIIESGQSISMNLFFLRKTEAGLSANNEFCVLYSKVKRQEGTVNYRLVPQKVNPLHENLNFIDIEMTKEDREWKINDAEIVEAIYADFFF